jgi:hypothetical protein
MQICLCWKSRVSYLTLLKRSLKRLLNVLIQCKCNANKMFDFKSTYIYYLHTDWKQISYTKEHFTLRPLIERTRFSINVISGEQKFVCSAFVLKVNDQNTTSSKMPTWQHFLWVLAPRVCLVDKSLCTIVMETQTLLKKTNFSFQTYTNSTICIF